MTDLTKGYYMVRFNDGSFSVAFFEDEGIKQFREWVLKNKPDYKIGLLNARGAFLEFLASPDNCVGDGIWLGANHQDEAIAIPQDWESWGL